MPRLHVILPDDLHREAKVEATMNGESLKDFVIAAVAERLDRKRRDRIGEGYEMPADEV
jgi:hypothetical protein